MEHHPHVNNLRLDPEKASSMGLKAGSFAVGNIMRLNPLDERKWRHLGQHVYFVLYMMFYGIFNFIFSITYSITGQGTQAWLPDGYSQIFRSYVFGLSGFWTMAPATLRCKI